MGIRKIAVEIGSLLAKAEAASSRRAISSSRQAFNPSRPINLRFTKPMINVVPYFFAKKSNLAAFADQKLIFFLNSSTIHFNQQNLRLEVSDVDELIKKYQQIFPADENFFQWFKCFDENLNAIFKSRCAEFGGLRGFSEIIDKSKKKSEIKISNPRKIYSYGDHRQGSVFVPEFDIGNTTLFHHYCYYFISNFIQSEVILELTKKDPRIDYNSSKMNNTHFLRDDIIIIKRKEGDLVCSVDPRVYEATKYFLRHPSLSLVLEKLKARSEIAKKELLNDEEFAFCKEVSIPFFLKGGNIIQHENVLLICVDESSFIDYRNFSYGVVVREEDSIMVKNYDEYCNYIKKWASEIGMEALVVNRNFAKYDIGAIYHADVFCNVVNGYLVIDFDAVTKESEKQLRELFGDKIVEINAKERSDLCTNFVQIGDDTILASQDVGAEFIGKMQKIGVQVIVPDVKIGQKENDGARCRIVEAKSFLHNDKSKSKTQ